MRHCVEVKFRGEDVWIEIDHDGGYEPDTNSQTIEWHFEGMTPDEQSALNLTDEEEQAIYLQLSESLYDTDRDWMD